MLEIRPLQESDWPSVREIYQAGIDTGIATFETRVPSWDEWDAKHVPSCRLVAEKGNKVVGYAVLAPVSKREVYKGVAEVSVYVDPEFRSQQIGAKLLEQLILESEKEGVWSLQAGIFPQNIPSIKLHEKFNFRLIGTKEKIGKLGDRWFDNLFFERRSKTIGI